MKNTYWRTSVLAVGLTVASGCATQRPYSPSYGMLTTHQGAAPSSETAGNSVANDQTRPQELQVLSTPRLGDSPAAIVGLEDGSDLPPIPNRSAMSINVEGVPIRVFANEVFGNMLGLTVKLDPDVTNLQELVTLNTSDRLPPQEMFLVARQVLADYGVAVRREGNVLRVSTAPGGSSALPPLIVSGRALPQVPISHRPVFQLVEMEAIAVNDASRFLGTIFGNELTLTTDPTRNMLLLSGKPDIIRKALAALQVLDRPTMRGRISTRLQPAFLTAEQLAKGLTDVMNAQGYSASPSVNSPAAITILPVTSANSVLIFASSQQALDYAVSWAKDIDRANPNAGDKSMFHYQVRNTKAEEIAEILNSSTRHGNTSDSSPSAAPTTPAGPGSTAGSGTTRGSSSSGQVIVDAPRNALIFQGEPAQWERMLGLIRHLDQAPRQVMIEVTIAEISLDNQLEYGVSWFAKNGFQRFGGRVSSGSLPSSSGGSSGGTGLTYLLDVAGQNRMALTAFANDGRVTVLSRPRLLVKSGHEASIDVGTEIPTITMQTTSNQTTDGNSNLLQTIQYRKTGIITSVTPTVYSDSRVDLEIGQEVSEALQTGVSIGGSPSIFNRSLKTSVSLRDGGSVVMAGLISERQTHGNEGIPLLKDIPVLGNLFKSTTKQRGRTELVIMIVPYIVETNEQTEALSNAVINDFDILDLPILNEPASLPGPTPSKPSPGLTSPPVPSPSARK